MDKLFEKALSLQETLLIAIETNEMWSLVKEAISIYRRNNNGNDAPYPSAIL